MGYIAVKRPASNTEISEIIAIYKKSDNIRKC